MRGRMFGRDAAIADLRAMLLIGPGIVTVVGTGGVGKSTLVEQATRDPDSWSPWGVERIVVELADVNSRWCSTTSSTSSTPPPMSRT